MASFIHNLLSKILIPRQGGGWDYCIFRHWLSFQMLERIGTCMWVREAYVRCWCLFYILKTICFLVLENLWDLFSFVFNRETTYFSNLISHCGFKSTNKKFILIPVPKTDICMSIYPCILFWIISKLNYQQNRIVNFIYNIFWKSGTTVTCSLRTFSKFQGLAWMILVLPSVLFRTEFWKS